MRTAAIRSVVRTGRRMKSSVFTTGSRRLGRLDLHARAGHEAQLAVGDDALARGHAAAATRPLATAPPLTRGLAPVAPVLPGAHLRPVPPPAHRAPPPHASRPPPSRA